MKPYKREFYLHRHDNTSYSAIKILELVLELLPEVSSAVDVGCGVGTWLSVLKEKGVTDICGIDGEWVEPCLLRIPEDDFLMKNLNSEWRMNRTYDLAISLEVAEHIPEENAGAFIKSLTDLSDFVLFSAAVPFQGGHNHVNEQWQEYWVKKFTSCGFIALDVIRRCIWYDENIPYWYRQNIMLVVRKERLPEVRLQEKHKSLNPLSSLHPEMLINPPLKASLKMVWRAGKRWFLRKTGR